MFFSKREQDRIPKEEERLMKKNFAIEYLDVVPFMKQKLTEKQRKRQKQGTKRKQKRKTRRKKERKNKRETEKEKLKKGEAKEV